MNKTQDNNEAEYGLVVSFSGLYQTMAEEHAFVRGAEFGGLWARMKGGKEAEIEGAFHAANRIVIDRACASQGLDAEITPIDGYAEWINVKLTKRRVATANPHGLRVIRSLQITGAKNDAE